MEMRHLMKIPKYCELWVKSYGNELLKLAQRIPDRVEVNNTIMFINIEDIQDKYSSLLLGEYGKFFVQEVTGTFLYYDLAFNCTILPALVSIATQQANYTENTMKK